MLHYVALIRQSADHDFTLSFPDLPGHSATGLTADGQDVPATLLGCIDDAANDWAGFLVEAAERLLAERDRPVRCRRVLRM